MTHSTSKQLEISEDLTGQQLARAFMLGHKSWVVEKLRHHHCGLTALTLSELRTNEGAFNELCNLLIDEQYELLNTEFPKD